MRALNRRGRAVGLAAALVAAAPVAGAQPAPAAQEGGEARADALFKEARVLLEQRRFAEACAKLAESEALDPGLGTQLALAYCHEQEGKLGTALDEYKQLQHAAHAAGQSERVKVARERITALDARAPRLTVRLAPGADPATTLTVDAKKLAVEPGVPISVDPGSHEVVATVPGGTPWRANVELGEGERKEVTVPVLQGAAPAGGAPATMPVTEPPRGGSGRRTAAFVSGGLGVAALAVGGYFGVQAIGKSSDAYARCPSSPCGDRGAVEDNEVAKDAALVSTVAVGVGVVALGVGLVLLLTSRTPPARTASSPVLVW